MTASMKDLAEAIASALSDIPDCRVHAYPPDTFVPPGVVVQQPTLQWDSTSRTFDTVEWLFPIAVVAGRQQDIRALSDLNTLVTAVADRLGDDTTLGGIAEHSRLLDARPDTVGASGTDYPAYIVNLQVIA